MHVFLQGPLGIGKSTVIRKTLALLTADKNIRIGGFFTRKGGSGDPHIYIQAANPGGAADAYRFADYDGDNVVCYPEVFDREGVRLLKDAVTADIICMDELGFLERGSTLFQAQVLSCLDGNIPILGVLREGDIAWHDAIKAHPSVAIFEVSAANRNALPEMLVGELGRSKL